MAAKTISICALFLSCLCAIAQAAPPTAPVSSAPSANGPPVVEPIIDWGKCPQLAPTEEQRKTKTEIIRQCLDKHPLGSTDNLNAAAVEKHRILLGECALNKEDWFNADKTYKYDKAEDELKKKDVEASIKSKILEQHAQCKQQALEKFPANTSVIEQVQFYQSCMDFHVSQLCSIKIMLPPQ